MEPEQVQIHQGECGQCDNPLCVGAFYHDWVDSDDSLLQAVLSYSESDMPTNLAVVEACDNDGSEPPPSPKRGWFHNATDEELTVAAAGIVPKNTESNNRWALCNFEAWRAHYNGLHPDTPCREDVLLTGDANELDYWLSRFVMETRKEDGSPFPSRSIKLILSGLQRHMRANSQSPFNIFNKDDHHFRRFRSTCDTVFKKLLAEGIGAHVKHHTAFMP